MRETASKGKAKAFAVVELLLILGMLAVFAVLLLPSLAGSHKSLRIVCVNNLKIVGVALNMFAEDHSGQYPMETSITNGGSMEFVGTGSPAVHFQTISNYIGGHWGRMLCPNDKSKQPATNGAVLSDRNISYFLSMDATRRATNMILAGDRSWELAGKAVKPGLFTLTTNVDVRWKTMKHKGSELPVCANLLFVDGHVETPRGTLPPVVQRQGVATNRLAFP